MAYLPADTLRNRTFIGLLIAQFLAAFNDQAIHASAMFFAINQKVMTDAQAISLMPILFYAPWATLRDAGRLLRRSLQQAQRADLLEARRNRDHASSRRSASG